MPTGAIDNVWKPTSLRVCQEKFNREKRGGMDEYQAVQGAWTKWLEAKQEGCAVVFSLQVLQIYSTMAEQPAQPCLALASSLLAKSTGMHGAAQAASSSNCKFDLMWILSLSYHLLLQNSNEADKNNAKLSSHRSSRQQSTLLEIYFSVFIRNTLKFQLPGKTLIFRCILIENSLLSHKPQEWLWKSGFSVNFNLNKKINAVSPKNS